VDHLDALRGEGAAFAGVLDQADAGLAVPACGDWRLRELAHHLGGVHRWAAASALGDGTAPPEHVPPLPPDDALADWLREGLDALTVALAGSRASVLDLRRACNRGLVASPPGARDRRPPGRRRARARAAERGRPGVGRRRRRRGRGRPAPASGTARSRSRTRRRPSPDRQRLPGQLASGRAVPGDRNQRTRRGTAASALGPYRPRRPAPAGRGPAPRTGRARRAAHPVMRGRRAAWDPSSMALDPGRPGRPRRHRAPCGRGRRRPPLHGAVQPDRGGQPGPGTTAIATAKPTHRRDRWLAAARDPLGRRRGHHAIRADVRRAAGSSPPAFVDGPQVVLSETSTTVNTGGTPHGRTAPRPTST